MTPSGSDTRFGIMRHGETEWNRDKRIQGQSDSPLTALGRETARRWARWLASGPWDRLLVSDLGRARKTAAIINAQLKLPQTADDRLREQDWGAWTARTIAELRRAEPDRLHRMEAKGWLFQPPDGESREAVWQRSSHALCDAARQWPGQSILVIAHGGVIKSLLYRLMGRRFLPSEPPVLLPRALHRLRHGPQGLAIEERNAVDLHSTRFLR